jgi:hypothetical protein
MHNQNKERDKTSKDQRVEQFSVGDGGATKGVIRDQHTGGAATEPWWHLSYNC